MKKAKQYHGCGEEYKVEERERGSNIIPFNIEAFGKNIKWGIGEEDGIFGEENLDLK